MARSTGLMRAMAATSCRPHAQPRVAAPGRSACPARARWTEWASQCARTTKSCPLEMPPRMPPALLDANRPAPAGRCWRCPGAGRRAARADLHRLHRAHAHERIGQTRVQLVEHRSPRPAAPPGQQSRPPRPGCRPPRAPPDPLGPQRHDLVARRAELARPRAPRIAHLGGHAAQLHGIRRDLHAQPGQQRPGHRAAHDPAHRLARRAAPAAAIIPEGRTWRHTSRPHAPAGTHG